MIWIISFIQKYKLISTSICCTYQAENSRLNNKGTQEYIIDRRRRITLYVLSNQQSKKLETKYNKSPIQANLYRKLYGMANTERTRKLTMI